MQSTNISSLNSDIKNIRFKLTGTYVSEGYSAYGAGRFDLDNSAGIYKKVIISNPSGVRELTINGVNYTNNFAGTYAITAGKIAITIFSNPFGTASADVEIL